MVKGSVPGKKNSIVYLKDSVKKSKWKYQFLI
jgi:ribosomal protein L3